MARLRSACVLSSVVILLVGGCTATGSDHRSVPKVAVDNATAKTVLPALADAGPGVHAMKASRWLVETKAPKDPLLGSANVHSVVDGHVVTVSASGLEAYDGVSGKRRWHYKESGRSLRGYAATGGAIVVLTRPGGAVAGADRWVGLEAATGRILWTGGDKGIPISGTNRILAGAGLVPVRPRAHAKGVVAIDARTGRSRWSQWDLGGATCQNEDPGTVEGDGSLFFVKTRCKDGTRQTLALDPATGKERWRHVLNGSLTVRRGVTLLSGGGETKVISPDGRVLSRDPFGARCPGGCLFAATDGHVAVAYDLQGRDDHRLLVIDTRTGKATDLTGRGPYLGLAAAGGTFYGLRARLAEPLLASGVDVIPAGDLRNIRSLAVPSTVGQFNESLGGPRVQSLHAAGGRIYVTDSFRGGTWFTWAFEAAGADRAGPAELGGVPVSDWPDACSLAPSFRRPEFLSDEAQDARIGAVRLKRVSCRIQEKQGERSVVRVTIGWVAATPEEASDLISKDKSLAVSGLGDEAYSFERATRFGLMMRVGRYLVAFDNDDEAARRAAEEITRTLRQKR